LIASRSVSNPSHHVRIVHVGTIPHCEVRLGSDVCDVLDFVAVGKIGNRDRTAITEGKETGIGVGTSESRMKRAFVLMIDWFSQKSLNSNEARESRENTL
jgi:hypothetical protein